MYIQRDAYLLFTNVINVHTHMYVCVCVCVCVCVYTPTFASLVLGC